MLYTILVLLAAAGPALADEPPVKEEDRQIIYKERTEIDFEGLEIQGELIKPQGALLLERHRAHFNPLIKLRADFDKEMNDSVDEIK